MLPCAGVMGSGSCGGTCITGGGRSVARFGLGGGSRPSGTDYVAGAFPSCQCLSVVHEPVTVEAVHHTNDLDDLIGDRLELGAGADVAGLKTSPTPEMLGIDLVLPGLLLPARRTDDIEAIVLTHGHEDHVGALPYVLREIGAPPVIYGGQLTIGMVRSKLDEHKLSDAPLQELAAGRRPKPGPSVSS